jgi:fumarylacetoacetate (FAA) hydrolase family protein
MENNIWRRLALFETRPAVCDWRYLGTLKRCDNLSLSHLWACEVQGAPGANPAGQGHAWHITSKEILRMGSVPLALEQFLPEDGFSGTLVGRAWLPDEVAGPAVIAIREDGFYDISEIAPTMSGLLDLSDAAASVKRARGRRAGAVTDLVGNSGPGFDRRKPFLLAPCDLQVIKAAGVTFASSLIERVIEEQARGDSARAEAVRKQVVAVIGENLRSIKPGSPEALKIKQVLIQQGLWSQYLEVGIGVDAEVFTKAPVLSAVGTGAEIGIHPDSAWNNPEPEIVLAVNSRGEVVGAALGNDVNLRDFEGRSALLLPKAKDNNASCAIGPYIRLFDGTFSLADVRSSTISLLVKGNDGFTLRGASSMAQISRDPLDLVSQSMGQYHQYPDGMVLFLGTMFAPIEDRDQPGSGFTHKVGDVVYISSSKLGTLVNRVELCNRIAPWVFGVRALFAHLAATGRLK